jgi:glycogen synthase
MNICLVSQQYPPDIAGGGIGTQTFLKAHGLAERGHSVHVVSSTLGGPARSHMDGRITLHRLPYPTVNTSFCETSVLLVGYSWAVAKKLSALMRSETFDIIEFPEYGAEGFIFQLETSERRHTPTVVMLHGSLAMFADRIGWPPADSDFYKVGSLMEETVVLKADLLLSASRNIANYWAARYGPRLPPIEVIHTAVDPTKYRGGGVRPGGRPTVLFVGRIDRYKGVFTIADAVLGLRGRYPDILCRFVGGADADSAERLREKIRMRSAERNFELLGYIDNDLLGQYYADCDVFASPAPQEHGVATVYLEAMAAGKPVVACNSGGTPEAVIDGQTGLLIAPGDVDALSRALDRLLGDPNLRDRLGTNGRQSVTDYFCASKMVERTEAMYERLAADFPTATGPGGPDRANAQRYPRRAS